MQRREKGPDCLSAASFRAFRSASYRRLGAFVCAADHPNGGPGLMFPRQGKPQQVNFRIEFPKRVAHIDRFSHQHHIFLDNASKKLNYSAF
jgi:hypothetical protein